MLSLYQFVNRLSLVCLYFLSSLHFELKRMVHAVDELPNIFDVVSSEVRFEAREGVIRQSNDEKDNFRGNLVSGCSNGGLKGIELVRNHMKQNAFSLQGGQEDPESEAEAYQVGGQEKHEILNDPVDLEKEDGGNPLQDKSQLQVIVQLPPDFHVLGPGGLV